MTTATAKTANESQIRQLVEDWTKALRAKDIDALMADYASEFVAFELAPPLRYGADAYRNMNKEWLTTFKGPVGSEMRDLSITAGGDVAFCHCRHRISGARTDGEQTDLWLRVTVDFRKIAGRWKVTHEHASVPFYMDGSMRAAIDLKP